MKIALVARHVSARATSADPYAAEQAAHVSGLARALAALDHQVVIYARRDTPGTPARETLAPGLVVRYITAGPAAPLPADQLPQHVAEIGEYLAAHWKKDRPDIVHAHHWTSGLAAMLAAHEVPVPMAATFGSLAIAEQRHGVPGPHDHARIRMEACIGRSVAGVVAHTSDEATDLSRLGIPGTRARVIPCGVDTSSFQPEGPAAMRHADLRLLHIGSLADHQGLEQMLRSLPDLPAAELVIAGGPEPDDLDSDIACKKLGKLAAGLGVADRVTITGQVSDTNLPALIRSADLFVSTARYEPFGSAALSAMACGKPVIASAVGGYADAVVDGTTGLLLPDGRPQMLVKRLRELLATPMKLTGFGIAAADRARSRFPWERIATETIGAYERCLAASAISEPDHPQQLAGSRRAGGGTEQRRAA
ncbi:MAG: glycosyltransferase [Nocardiopsaceae bacterium]|jgi:glycosyltransferase involved in cell wall biosynthesis|nr:glycosyltransferase [Nocardiopsaceae bacterium]